MLLRLEKVHAYYGPTHALRGISLDVPKGGIVTLLGGNGSGKTTVINTISGFVQCTDGTIELNGKRIDRLPAEERVRIGITQVPQGREIFPELTVAENLEMGAYVRKDRRAIKCDYELVFAYFPRLRERISQLAGSLSGGEQQMLAVGRGIMARPQVFLMDEPSAGLAPALVRKIFDVIKSIQDGGNTILLVEQNVHMALEISEYGYILKHGNIVFEGGKDTLYDLSEIKETFLGGSQITEITGEG